MKRFEISDSKHTDKMKVIKKIRKLFSETPLEHKKWENSKFKSEHDVCDTDTSNKHVYRPDPIQI